MSGLFLFDYQEKDIRFENREGQIWVNLTDMAKVSGKRINNWFRLPSTKDYLEKLESDLGHPVYQSVIGNLSKNSGTWAIDEVAIDFAGWCSVGFKIWVNRQIKTLMTEGEVHLSGNTNLSELPSENYKEVLKALIKKEEEYYGALKALIKKEEEKELLALQNQLQEQDLLRQAEVIDELFGFSSIIRIAKYNGCSEKAFSWQKLKSASKLLGLEIKQVPCPRYEVKNLYSHDAWRFAYPEYKLPEHEPTTSTGLYLEGSN